MVRSGEGSSELGGAPSVAARFCDGGARAVRFEAARAQEEPEPAGTRIEHRGGAEQQVEAIVADRDQRRAAALVHVADSQNFRFPQIPTAETKPARREESID